MKKSSVSKSSAVKSSVRGTSSVRVASAVVKADISKFKADRYGINFNVASGVVRLTNGQIAHLFEATWQK